MSDDDKISLDELTDMVDDATGKTSNDEPPAADASENKTNATQQDESDKLADAFANAMQLSVEVSAQDKPDRTVFQNKMSPLLSVLGQSPVAATAFAEQVKSGVATKTVKPEIAVFVLNGLAARCTAEARTLFSAKKIDFPNLADQCRQFLAGKLEWQAVVPQTKAVAAPAPTPPAPVPTPEPRVTRVPPGLITARELAASLKITVVDVLAFAGLTEGDGSTMVSSSAVMAAIAASKAEPPKADKNPKAVVYDWKAGEAEFERSDPAWRPKVESTGDELLDNIAANQALVDEWLSESP